MWHFLSFVFGGLAMFAISMLMFRTYMRMISTRFHAYESRLAKKDQSIKEKTRALQQIMHRVHHEGLRPKSATFMGLSSLLSPIMKELRLNIDQCKKPDHHRWASLAESQVNELDEVTTRMEIIAKDLHTYVGDSVKEFEHLQDD
jgi:hypothetical protein